MKTTSPTFNQPHPSFWRALLTVRNALIKNPQTHHILIPYNQKEGRVFESFSIVDKWIEVAIEDGWIDADLM